MRILFTIICISCCLCIAIAGNTEADSLAAYYHRIMIKDKPYEIGLLKARCYVYGFSTCLDSGFVGRRFYRHLPFQSRPSSQTAFEADYALSYSFPGNLKIKRNTINSNNQRVASSALTAFERIMLPVFSLRREQQSTSVKAYVMPFSIDGMNKYKYSLRKSVNDEYDTIFFVPKHKHQTLLTGYALHDSTTNSIRRVHLEGQVLLGKLEGDIVFAMDSVTLWFLPTTFDASIEYRIGGTAGINHYHCRYEWDRVMSLNNVRATRYRPLDMSPLYTTLPSDTVPFRPERPSSFVDSIIRTDDNAHYRRKKRLGTKLLEILGDGQRLSSENDEAKIYGPLNPASFGIGGIDGFWIRFRASWSHRFRNHKLLVIKPQIGYSFKRKELKYRLSADYIYNVLHPGGLSVSAERGNSGFSSSFVDMVNEALKSKTDTIDFSKLGVDFYNHYSYRISNYNEIANGLILRVGVIQNYRTPVLHGVNAVSEEHREAIIDKRYSDFSPFVELTWTPRKYYYVEDGSKRYVGSAYPTFKLWASRSIPGVLGTSSNYGDVEVDVQQVLRINYSRTLSLRVGGGYFHGKDGEYFINYEYFSRGRYPDIWQDEHVGGTFRILDDYWYSSTKMYAQIHAMYETPFGIVNRIPLLSRYMAKERYYVGSLFTDGKPVYTELGYGFGNNFFSTGLFVGFKGTNYYSIGYKIQIAIDKYLR